MSITLIEKHLEAGGSKGSGATGLWEQLCRFARLESAYAPLQNAVRRLNKTFSPKKLREAVLTAQPLAVPLFDSFSRHLAGGARPCVTNSREMLYGAGSYRIEVRIEPQVDPERIALIGRIFNSADPDEQLAALPVTLVQGNRVLAEAATNQFGEFRIELGLEGGFKATFTLPFGGRISLSLIDPVFGEFEGSVYVIDSKNVTGDSQLRNRVIGLQTHSESTDIGSVVPLRESWVSSKVNRQTSALKGSPVETQKEQLQS